MGTVIRHVTSSKLFDKVLAPLTPYLHEINYVGDISVNCIVAGGTPLPLEFTARWGWPDFALRLEALHGDPVEFMAALVHGEDKFIVTPDVVVGVVLAHGDFPRGGDPLGTWGGFPISFGDDAHLYWEHVKRGEHPQLDGTSKRGLVTAGNYVAVATARGKTVSGASAAAYAVVESVSWPGDIIVRDDIGEHLERDLPKLQEHGYALGMEY
jgi:phosphoribosylamine---glycine ligase